MKKDTRILVVDDDEFIRDGLTDLLNRDGHFVDTSPSGEDALDKVSNNIYNLVITDIKMPGMDGMGLLKEVKQLKPNLNVVLITAYATVETAIKAMKYGASDFITKPFKVDNILRIVNINTRSFRDYIVDESLIHNETRNRIHDFISTNPGEHYRAIQTKLQLGNGVLNYHLRLMEKNNLIKPKRDGIYKRYYPRSLKIPVGRTTNLSKIQKKIVKLVENSPGIMQTNISTTMEISRQLTSYHVNKLVRSGVLRSIKDGNQSRFWLD